MAGKDGLEVVREPASPITYGRWDRRADRRHGRRDGLRRIPSLAEVTALVNMAGPTQVPTPYLEMLVSRAQDMIAHERLLFEASTAALRAEQAKLESMSAAPRAAVEAARAWLAQVKVIEVTEADLVPRYPVEEQYSEVFMRIRRETERTNRIAAAELALQRALAELHQHEHQLAAINGMIDNRLAVARLRALRISAYISARIATYWEGLVLAHRDGTHLAPLLPYLSPRLPEWVTATNSHGSSPDGATMAIPSSGAGAGAALPTSGGAGAATPTSGAGAPTSGARAPTSGAGRAAATARVPRPPDPATYPDSDTILLSSTAEPSGPGAYGTPSAMPPTEKYRAGADARLTTPAHADQTAASARTGRLP